MSLFRISLISSTHYHTIANVWSTSNTIKKTTIMLLYRNESTLLPNKSTVSLTFGLIGVLIELADFIPNFFKDF